MLRQIMLLIRKIGRKFGYGWQKEWERCTISFKKAIFFAEDAAYKLNHNQITPEHFLLGLIYEEDNIASSILKQIDVDLMYLREILEKSIFYSMYDLRQTTNELRLTPRGRKALELAFAKADELGNNYINTKHLLFGILQEKGLAAQILNKLGVNEELFEIEKENFIEI